MCYVLCVLWSRYFLSYFHSLEIVTGAQVDVATCTVKTVFSVYIL